jgi:hypothetical protein
LLTYDSTLQLKHNYTFAQWAQVNTGSGLPAGKFGLLGAAEGLSYLSIAVGIAIIGFQFSELDYSLKDLFGFDHGGICE